MHARTGQNLYGPLTIVRRAIKKHLHAKTFHLSTSQYKLISKKRRNISFNYTLEGSKLEFLDKIKYLGVYITSDLNWKYHINAMCNKASRTLGLLKRNLKMCPKSVKLQAYKGLVRPGLEYASAAWDPFKYIYKTK